MFGFIEIIIGAKAVVPLVPGVIKIIEKLSEQKQDPTLVRIVQQVRLDTIEGAQKLRSFVSWVEETKPNIFLSRTAEDNLCKYFKRWGKGYSETNMRINHSSLNSSIVRSA